MHPVLIRAQSKQLGMRPRRRCAFHVRVVLCASAGHAGAGRWIGILGPIGTAGFGAFGTVGGGGDRVVGGYVFRVAVGGDIRGGLLTWVGGGAWGCVLAKAGGGHPIHFLT